ncbi:MAG: hypothetical protein ACKPFA_22480 [Dolichospermum sp.]
MGTCVQVEKVAQDGEVSIQLRSPASGNSSILTPYWVRCPETVSEGQEKSVKTTNRQRKKPPKTLTQQATEVPKEKINITAILPDLRKN